MVERIHMFYQKGGDLKYPADLYLEGSDQHRGWFQSSLLSSIIENDKAPYKEVLTHGFMTDSTGAKLSKSLGNVISVEDILNKYGIDVFRLWIVSADYFGDLKISDQIMQSSVDVYRKIRNTLRYLLAALKDHKIQNVQYDDLDFFDKLILAKIYKINKEVKESKDFDFKTIYTKIHNFCNDDLSAFYFDIKKDSLYCDDINSIRYKSNIFTLNHIFENLIRWIAPVLSFTAEEAFLNRHKNEQSVHLKEFLSIDKEFDNDKVLNDSKFIMELRSKSNIKIEKARNEKQIGSSLECDLKIIIDKRTLAIIKEYNIDINEMMIVSNHEINVTNDSNSDIIIKKAKGEKCKRCWKITKVLANGVCERCDIVCKKIAC